MADMTRLALAIRPGAGWSALLPGAEAGPDGPANLPPAIPPALQVLRAALARADSFSAAEPLGYLLGLGSGLTPSGDDLALGLLLAVSRWGEVLAPRLNRDDFTTRVVQQRSPGYHRSVRQPDRGRRPGPGRPAPDRRPGQPADRAARCGGMRRRPGGVGQFFRAGCAAGDQPAVLSGSGDTPAVRLIERAGFLRPGD